jgi:hypothetical protein
MAHLLPKRLGNGPRCRPLPGRGSSVGAEACFVRANGRKRRCSSPARGCARRRARCGEGKQGSGLGVNIAEPVLAAPAGRSANQKEGAIPWHMAHLFPDEAAALRADPTLAHFARLAPIHVSEEIVTRVPASLAKLHVIEDASPHRVRRQPRAGVSLRSRARRRGRCRRRRHAVRPANPAGSASGA